jgi:hypothetical protein
MNTFCVSPGFEAKSSVAQSKGLAMYRTRLIIVAAVVALSSCEDIGPVAPVDPNVSAFTASFDSIQITDAEVLRITYSSYKKPATFYSEDLPRDFLYYENTVSIGINGPGEVPWIELSTNSHAQAIEWFTEGLGASSWYGPMIGESETERYFEFRCKYQGDSTYLMHDRVHKLSYLDRSMFDALKPTPLIGRFNFRPLDETSVKQLVEYLWFIQTYQIGGRQALAAEPAQTRDTVYCALYELSTSYGDWGLRDQITLRRTVYAVSRATGDIDRRTYTLRGVQGKRH